MSQPQLYLNGHPVQSGYTITIYRYEPFDYAFSFANNPSAGKSGYVYSKSTLIQSLVSAGEWVGDDTWVYFTSPGYPQYPGPRLPIDQTLYGGYTGTVSYSEQIVFSVTSGGTTVLYTINVIISPGRFVVPLLAASSYTLYKNESIATTFGSPIRFQAPGNLRVTAPFTTPALPPGIGFVPVGSSPTLYWDLTGTPLTQTPATSYIVYARGSGTDSSKVIAKTIALGTEAERVVSFVTPSSNISMTTGSAIATTTLTSRYPASFPGNLRYDWGFLPDGLRFLDNTSNPVTSPFFPLDASSTMILSGTPTVSAAQYFRALGTSNVVTNVVATRQTSPAITTTQSFSLTFTPTVLFDSVFIPTLYAGVPLNPSSNVFTANTYFPFSGGMASITASSLPTGLSLLHTPGDSNAYLTGTPTVAGSGTYGITATNSNGLTQTLNAPITVAPDVITISGPANDVCYNFVISRPLNTPLTGYYPASISYSASAASGANVTLSVTNLAGTGITVTSSGSTLSLSGIPDTITPLTTAVITANAPFTGATATRNLNFEVLTDDVFITNPTSQLNFVQNKAIAPVQFAATTLSERPIVNWSSSNLPDGLFISSTGRLTGTPTGNTFVMGPQTFDVVASTGYVSETNSFTYETVRDDILITLLNNPTIVSDPFSAEIRKITYSGGTAGAEISAIAPLQFPPVTLGISGNLIVGDIATAGTVLPQYRFRVDASTGSLVSTDVFDLTIANPSTQRRFVLDTSLTAIPSFTPPSTWNFAKGAVTLYKNESSLFTFPNLGQTTMVTTTPSNWTTVLSVESAYGQVGDVAQSGDTCVLVTGANMYRSSDGGNNWSLIPSSNIASIPGIVGDYVTSPVAATSPGPLLPTLASDGSLNWLAIGRGYDSNSSFASRVILRTSSNDGVTWTDVSLALNTSPQKLYYNQGRYFLALQNATNPAYRIDASNVSSWTGSSGGMPTFTGNEAYAFAFSNSTVLLGGNGTTPLYKSTDNGTAWSSLVVGAATSVVDIAQSGGFWFLATNDGLYRSSNATTFTKISTKVGRALAYDGAAVNMLYADSPPTANMLTASTTQVTTGNTNMLTATAKRMMTRILSNGTPSGLLSLSASSSTFVSPTVTDYSFYQFVGVNIPVQVTPTSNFIYYYSDLPQGLSLVTDASGIAADISGIPTLFTGGYQTSYVFARDSATSPSTVTTLALRNRVILPFIVKKQGGAADYTALVRQYATVNGAQAARDSVALPVQERPLGEFMSPDAPSVITQTVDPKCYSTSNCT